MQPRRAPFTLLLPLLSLALWVAIIAVPATLMYRNLRSISKHDRGVNFHSLTYNFTVPRNQFLTASLMGAAYRSKHSIEALDMPAFSVQILFDRFSSAWPMDWAPKGMDFVTWRAVIFPVYCLPFWWFVGLGTDGLLQRRRLRWPIYVVGSLFCVGFIVLILGLTLGVPPEDRHGSAIYLWGFALWIVLFGVFPTAWIRVWLRGRKQRQPAHPSL